VYVGIHGSSCGVFLAAQIYLPQQGDGKGALAAVRL